MTSLHLSEALYDRFRSPKVTAAVATLSNMAALVPPATLAQADALIFGALGRDVALSVPAIARARDLLCGALSSMPLTATRDVLDAAGVVTGETPIALPSWTGRPDPQHSRTWIVSATADDLIFHGYAAWEITGRLATGYPSRFRYLPWARLHREVDQAGQLLKVSLAGRAVPLADFVLYESPLVPVLAYSSRVVATMLALDERAHRAAVTDLPAGVLKQRQGGEPMGGADLEELANQFSTLRKQNLIAAINNELDWEESAGGGDLLQALVVVREAMATEAARIMNVPAYLLHAPQASGMTYANAQQARLDLWDFGAVPLAQAFEETWSGPQVTPAGQRVRFDPSRFIDNPYDEEPAEPPTPDEEPAP